MLNAGPFTDIAALASFEQALARLPQAEDVYVRGFEGNRALVDIKLAAPLALLDEIGVRCRSASRWSRSHTDGSPSTSRRLPPTRPPRPAS